MNKHNAHLYLPLIEALSRGEVIEYRRTPADDWVDWGCSEINFTSNPECYRIKPKKETRYGRLVAGPNFLGSVWIDRLDVTPALNPGERWVGKWVPYEVEVE